MCLYTRNKNGRFTIFGKTVYKVMDIDIETGSLYSFVKHFRYELGKTYEKSDNIFKQLDSWWPDVKNNRVYEINGQGYHSYPLSFVKREFKHFIIDEPIALVKCRIPAFTRYYKGNDSISDKCYCSQKIKIESVIKVKGKEEYE